MPAPKRILVLGASYGALFGIKLVAAGQHVTLVGQPHEVALINADGYRVRLPVHGHGLVELHSKTLSGAIDAVGPDSAEPANYDLVVLAMQEPQHGVPAIRRLLAAIGAADRPVLSIMNMPPPPFLKRIPALEGIALDGCYADARVWDPIDPYRVTLCSPDPQAFRPPGEPVNFLQARLATNFKAAPFENTVDNGMLVELADGIAATRVPIEGKLIELPVKLRVHSSVFVPMAKWCMLMAGNYRCLLDGGIVSIRDAVHGDLTASRAIFDAVSDLCKALGAQDDDLVPFDKYANAALSLESPSSVARALAAGATNVERVDLLVKAIADQTGRSLGAIDGIVARVDARLVTNRAIAA